MKGGGNHSLPSMNLTSRPLFFFLKSEFFLLLHNACAGLKRSRLKHVPCAYTVNPASGEPECPLYCPYKMSPLLPLQNDEGRNCKTTANSIFNSRTSVTIQAVQNAKPHPSNTSTPPMGALTVRHQSFAYRPYQVKHASYPETVLHVSEIIHGAT